MDHWKRALMEQVEEAQRDAVRKALSEAADVENLYFDHGPGGSLRVELVHCSGELDYPVSPHMDIDPLEAARSIMGAQRDKWGIYPEGDAEDKEALLALAKKMKAAAAEIEDTLKSLQ